MASVTFTGLTEEEAEELANWYNGQGEQDADTWFDINLDQSAPMTDIWRNGGFKEIDENGNVTVYMR